MTTPFFHICNDKKFSNLSICLKSGTIPSWSLVGRMFCLLWLFLLQGKSTGFWDNLTRVITVVVRDYTIGSCLGPTLPETTYILELLSVPCTIKDEPCTIKDGRKLLKFPHFRQHWPTDLMTNMEPSLVLNSHF